MQADSHQHRFCFFQPRYLASLIVLAVSCMFPYLAHSQAAPVLSVAGVATATYPGGETTYRLDLLNHTDQIVFDGVISMTLPAGFTYVPGSTIATGEGWPLEQREPAVNGQTLTWGPYHLPAAGIQRHNPYGIHTLMNDCTQPPALHLEAAKELAGNGGYVTQLFYGIDSTTPGPGDCAVSYVAEAYARNLIPILRLQGRSVNGVWQAPDPGPNGDYAGIAQAFARYVAGLPRRDTNPLYIAVWNEPDLWIEWSGTPNAQQYARFFVAVSQAIKQLGDGRIRVVNGALTPGNNAFLDQMLRVPGFRDAFDVWASHCYPYNHPPTYNLHQRTARYGTYAIDCYLAEMALINRYGRSGFKAMLTETGYELGNQTFGFEGFSRINETNRASYIASTFAHYWQNWPEVVAVTPFQLTDTSGHWANFDWLYPTPPYARHAQFGAVAALPKPAGPLKPYGFQITFRASVSDKVTPGTYTGQLRGRDRDGNSAYIAQAAPVRVASGPFQLTYLPLIMTPTSHDGPWYFSLPKTASPGAIVPTAFLRPELTIQSQTLTSTEVITLNMAGEPQAIALVEEAGLGAIILTDGRLEIIDLITQQSKRTFFVGTTPQAITAGPPGTAQAYISWDDGLAQVDLQNESIVNKINGVGRLRGLALDASTHRLIAADASHDRLLVFSDDLSQQAASLALDCQPDQLILNPLSRQLYVSCPAMPQMLAVNADTLSLTARASLIGGPILDLAFDAQRQRLYGLSLLAPTHRGISIWQTPSLEPFALVAGAGDFPFQTASALALTPTGALITAEGRSLWSIDPASLNVSQIKSDAGFATSRGIAVQQNSGTIYVLDQTAHLLRIYP